MTVPQLNALDSYWRVTPPVDVMVAAYFGFGADQPSAPPPLPSPSKPSEAPLIPQAQPSKERLTKDKVMELLQMFPSGKITIN